MRERLTILGSGGWFPAQGRHTACALWRRGDAAILIDAGTGVGRLVEQPELLEGVARLDIVLTHFHLDHICGVAYLGGLELPAHTTAWGPGRLLYGVATGELLALMTREPFHPVSLAALDIEVRDLPPAEIDLGGIRLRTRTQPRHSAPTLGLRFDDDLTWITDTAYDPESAGFAAGSAMLAHEAWFLDAQPRNADIHSSAGQAAAVAREAGIEDLLLIHLPPFEADVRALADEARELVPRAELAREAGLPDSDGHAGAGAHRPGLAGAGA